MKVVEIKIKLKVPDNDKFTEEQIKEMKKETDVVKLSYWYEEYELIDVDIIQK